MEHIVLRNDLSGLNFSWIQFHLFKNQFGRLLKNAQDHPHIVNVHKVFFAIDVIAKRGKKNVFDICYTNQMWLELIHEYSMDFGLLWSFYLLSYTMYVFGDQGNLCHITLNI